MRIVSWNVNGLKSVRGYRPWYALPDWAACLELLGADMACVQEVKATRRALDGERGLMAPAGWTTFADLHPQRGYSGTATYVRSAACRPCAAEPGITGAARTPDGLALPPLAQPLACDDALWAQLDAEGRATVVDCGLFVLFNLYCPNETDETRREYKLTYNAALAARVEALLAAGREVIGAYRSGGGVCEAGCDTKCCCCCQCSLAEPSRMRRPLSHRC
jgi:AP endonuclease-2